MRNVTAQDHLEKKLVSDLVKSKIEGVLTQLSPEDFIKYASTISLSVLLVALLINFVNSNRITPAPHAVYCKVSPRFVTNR